MTPVQLGIIIGAIAIIFTLIAIFIILVNNDYVRHKHPPKHFACESCRDSTCFCDMGFTRGKSEGSGRSGQVPGKDQLQEAESQTTNDKP